MVVPDALYQFCLLAISVFDRKIDVVCVVIVCESIWHSLECEESGGFALKPMDVSERGRRCTASDDGSRKSGNVGWQNFFGVPDFLTS